MAIQFPCSGCGNQLSVPDSAAGKKARCPKCSTVIAVPASEDAEAGTAGTAGSGFGGVDMGAPEGGDDEYQLRPTEESPSQGAGTSAGYGSDDGFGETAGTSFAGGGAPAKPSPYSDNPYASPTMGYEEPQRVAKSHEPIVPTLLNFEAVFSRSWEIMTSQLGMVIAVVAIIWGISIGMSFVGGFVELALVDHEEALLLFQYAFNIVSWMVNVFFGIGQTMVLLDVARGRPADLGKIVAGGERFLRVIGASILFGLMVFFGVLLFIVPGIILALMFGQYYMLIIDKDMGVMDSFAKSKEITDGNKWLLFGIWLLVGFIVMVAAVVTCGLAVIISAPYLAVMPVVIYMLMAGQPLAKT